MPEVSPYREIAGSLRDEIFKLRWDGKLGDAEEDIPLESLKAVIAGRFATIGKPLSEERLTALATHFPPIDLTPDDAHPNEAEIWERETAYIAKLVEWALQTPA